MHALFRLRCDFSERHEVLQFINALGARVVMIHPLWVSFEVVGTPREVEGIYRATLGYGLLDQVSTSCTFMTSDVLIAEPAEAVCSLRGA